MLKTTSGVETLVGVVRSDQLYSPESQFVALETVRFSGGVIKTDFSVLDKRDVVEVSVLKKKERLVFDRDSLDVNVHVNRFAQSLA